MKKKMKDLSGDGKITKKDVLIGRGVIKRRMGGTMGGGMNPMGRSKDPTVESVTGYNPMQKEKVVVWQKVLEKDLLLKLKKELM